MGALPMQQDTINAALMLKATRIISAKWTIDSYAREPTKQT